MSHKPTTRKWLNYFIVCSCVFVGIISLVFFGDIVPRVFAEVSVNIPTTAVEKISIVSSVEHPKPYQSLHLSLDTTPIPLDSSAISWSVNGVEVAHGTGLKTFDYTTKGSGSSATIRVVVAAPDGKVYDQSIVISPSDVDLVWQAKAYTPPFYKGKALPSYQGDVLIVAIPDFGNPQNLIYTWKKDGNIISTASGYGKNTIDIPDSIFMKAYQITVEVHSADNSQSGSGILTISPQAPQVLLYESNPLYGIMYNRAVSTYSLQGQEIKLVASPFSYSLGSAMKYTWSINNSTVQTSSDNTITLRPPENTSGVSTVAVTASNQDDFLQFSTTDANISFGND